jgi:hypothetical protein
MDVPFVADLLARSLPSRIELHLMQFQAHVERHEHMLALEGCTGGTLAEPTYYGFVCRRLHPTWRRAAATRGDVIGRMAESV